MRPPPMMIAAAAMLFGMAISRAVTKRVILKPVPEFVDWTPLSDLRKIPAAASGIPNPPPRNQRQRRRDHRRTWPHGWKGGA